ncbi:MAG TPA: GrpB family protein [Ktedonobacteraceae bacterium]|nr:GrpB family protein [Ktedonobacteraceae bacterium]
MPQSDNTTENVSKETGLTPSEQPLSTEYVPLTEEQIQAAHLTEVVPWNGPILLVEYDPEWPWLFEREAARIRAALGERVLLLEHVGSTSVPGLAAKPRIDIVLAVADSSDESAYVAPLKESGYVLHIREPDWFQHRLFKGPDTAVNLHIFTQGCSEIDHMLLFRNRLRRNEADRQLYERTKKELAQQNWKYTQNYADAKTGVVREIMARAQADVAGEG